MTLLDYVILDLKRQKLETIFVAIGVSIPLTIALSITLFFTDISQIIYESLTSTMSLGLIRMYQVFHAILWLGVIILTALIVATLSLTSTLIRQKDITIMRGIGMPAPAIYSFFVYKILIILMLAISFSSLSSMSLYLLIHLGFPPLSTLFWFGITIFLTLFLGYLSSYQSIIDVIKEIQITGIVTPVTALAAKVKRRKRQVPWTITFAGRMVTRMSKLSKTLITTLFVVYLIASFSLFSSVIVLDTSKNYIYRASGRNVIVVGDSEILNIYSSLLSPIPNQSWQQIDFLEYEIQEDAYIALSSISGLKTIERRLLYYTEIREIPVIVMDPEGGYKTIGTSQTAETFVFGYDPDNCISNWYAVGDITAKDKVLVGDELDLILFEDPLNQKVAINEHVFEISAVIFDIFNKGNVLYVPLDNLQEIYNITSYNLIFLEFDSINDAIIDQVIQVIKQYNLVYVLLDSIIKDSLKLLESSWSVFNFELALIILSSTIAIIAYTISVFFVFSEDLIVALKVGAKHKNLTTIAKNIGIYITTIALIPATFLAIFFSINFVIPDPVLTFGSFFAVLLILLIIAIFSIVSFMAGKLLFFKFYFKQ